MITNKAIQERLSELLTHELKANHMTQKELAEKLSIGQQTISHYINKTKMPTLTTFAKLCAALEMDPSYILCLK